MSKNFVYEAVINFKAGDVLDSKSQLIAASSLRRALVKAEKVMEEQGADEMELVSVTKRAEVVI